MLVVHYPEGKTIPGCGEDSRGIVIPYDKNDTDGFPVFDIGRTMDEMGMSVASADLFIGGLECPAEWYGLEPGGQGVPPGQRCLVAEDEGTPLEVKGIKRYNGDSFVDAQDPQAASINVMPLRVFAETALPDGVQQFSNTRLRAVAGDCHRSVAAFDADSGSTVAVFTDSRRMPELHHCAARVLDIELEDGIKVLVDGRGPIPLTECSGPVAKKFEAGAFQGSEFALLEDLGASSSFLRAPRLMVDCEVQSQSLLKLSKNRNSIVAIGNKEWIEISTSVCARESYDLETGGELRGTMAKDGKWLGVFQTQVREVKQEGAWFAEFGKAEVIYNSIDQELLGFMTMNSEVFVIGEQEIRTLTDDRLVLSTTTSTPTFQLGSVVLVNTNDGLLAISPEY